MSTTRTHAEPWRNISGTWHVQKIQLVGAFTNFSTLRTVGTASFSAGQMHPEDIFCIWPGCGRGAQYHWCSGCILVAFLTVRFNPTWPCVTIHHRMMLLCVLGFFFMVKLSRLCKGCCLVLFGTLRTHGCFPAWPGHMSLAEDSRPEIELVSASAKSLSKSYLPEVIRSIMVIQNDVEHRANS